MGLSPPASTTIEPTNLWQTENPPVDYANGSHSAKAPSSEDPVLGGIIDRLVQIFRPERIYLFGSVARGDADPDSDYDLTIMVPYTTPAAMRDTAPAYRALWRAAVDLLVWTRAEFDSRLHLRASLPSTVQREGKLLYAA